MNLQEAYLFLLADSFMTSLLLPIQAHFAFVLMKIFDGYNMQLAIIVASFGVVLGSAANWGLGHFIKVVAKYQPTEGRALKFHDFVKKYGYLLLALSWAPLLGSIIVTGLGVVKTNFIKTMAIVFLVNIIYLTIWVLI